MLRDNQKIKLTFSNNESHNFSDSADFIMWYCFLGFPKVTSKNNLVRSDSKLAEPLKFWVQFRPVIFLKVPYS
jgi:hypothetical protein